MKDYWDQSYRAGRWNVLKDLREMAHYAIISGYVGHFCRGGKLLDVGCGEGILYQYLDPRSFNEYVGVDCSQVAIDSAHLTAPARLVCASIEDYQPQAGERFDAIVFNEVLYYLERPLEILDRYKTHLTTSGVIIISMYSFAKGEEKRKIKRIWKELDRSQWIVADTTIVTNPANRQEWMVRVLRAPA